MQKVNKVIIPTSGLGERFKPFTKIVEKSLLPILKKPLIHYLVEEAILSEAKEVIIVVKSKKSLVFKYFQNNVDFQKVKISFVVQKRPQGLVNALFLACKKINNEPFGLILGDELITYDKTPSLKILIDQHYKTSKNIIGVQKVAKEQLQNYGVVKFANNLNNEKLFKIKNAIEKPPFGKEPSEFAIIGRYVLNANFIDLIKKIGWTNKNLIDVLSFEIKNGNCYAYKISNKRYDVGSVKGFVEANNDFFRENKKNVY